MSNISLIAKHSEVFPFNLLVVIYYQELNPAIHSYSSRHRYSLPKAIALQSSCGVTVTIGARNRFIHH